MAWECRPARDTDATGIAEAIIAAWRTAYAELVPEAFLQSLDVDRIAELWRRAELEPRAFRHVLLSKGRVIGAASGGPARAATPSERAELYSINVHPEHWGHGAGRLLLGACERRLHEAGFAVASLWVVASNGRARRFYELAGWRPSGEQRNSSDLTGSPLHEICLEKELGRAA